MIGEVEGIYVSDNQELGDLHDWVVWLVWSGGLVQLYLFQQKFVLNNLWFSAKYFTKF